MPTSEEYKIEPAIAIPPKVHASSKFPFAQMRVGDSFFVRSETRQPSLVREAVKNFSTKNKGWFFVTRPMKDSAGRSGTRIWRVGEDLAETEPETKPDALDKTNPMQRPNGGK